MEKSKRKVILLVALIVGVCVPVSWILITFYFTNYNEIPMSAVHYNRTGVYPDVITPINNLIFFNIWVIWTFSSLFTIIPSIILNILGWFKNGKIRTLIAGILYLIGFNIPSAVLCFIGYVKLKKEIMKPQS